MEGEINVFDLLHELFFPPQLLNLRGEKNSIDEILGDGTFRTAASHDLPNRKCARMTQYKVHNRKQVSKRRRPGTTCLVNASPAAGGGRNTRNLAIDGCSRGPFARLEIRQLLGSACGSRGLWKCQSGALSAPS